MEYIDVIMKWIVAPISAFVLLIYRTQQSHTTDIAVLKATTQANKEAHDREFKEMRENFKSVLSKLESIEEALRK